MEGLCKGGEYQMPPRMEQAMFAILFNVVCKKKHFPLCISLMLQANHADI